MSDPQNVKYIQLPDNSYAMVDADTPKEKIAAMIASKFPKEFAAAKSGISPTTATGTIDAGGKGAGQYLQRLESDIRYGGESTLPGQILKKLGARGLNRGVTADNPITSTVLGPIKAAQGISETPEHPIAGPLKALGGVLDTASIPLAFMGNAPGTAESVLGKTIPSIMMEQGGQKIGQVEQIAGKVPVDMSLAGNQALKVKELLDAGAPTGGVSKLINQFIRRATSPDGPAMTLEEARRFYTNATAKTSAEELIKMSGPMKRQFSQFVGRLGESITQAAGKMGQAETYTSGMQQFASGASRHRALVNALKYGVGPAVGGGILTNYLINRASR